MWGSFWQTKWAAPPLRASGKPGPWLLSKEQEGSREDRGRKEEGGWRREDRDEPSVTAELTWRA